MFGVVAFAAVTSGRIQPGTLPAASAKVAVPPETADGFVPDDDEELHAARRLTTSKIEASAVLLVNRFIHALHLDHERPCRRLCRWEGWSLPGTQTTHMINLALWSHQMSSHRPTYGEPASAT